MTLGAGTIANKRVIARPTEEMVGPMAAAH